MLLLGRIACWNRASETLSRHGREGSFWGEGNVCTRNKRAYAPNYAASRAGQRSHQTGVGILAQAEARLSIQRGCTAPLYRGSLPPMAQDTLLAQRSICQQHKRLMMMGADTDRWFICKRKRKGMHQDRLGICFCESHP